MTDIEGFLAIYGHSDNLLNNNRCYSLTGPLCGWSAVVFSDRRYPSFRNFNSTISIDVIRMNSYMDSLFDPTCVPVRVTINKLNFFPNSSEPSRYK